MSLFINTNTAASNAANSLAYSNLQLQNSLNKLSSGSSIVKASDNAGGLGFESEIGANGIISNRHFISVGGNSIGMLVSTGADFSADYLQHRFG